MLSFRVRHIFVTIAACSAALAVPTSAQAMKVDSPNMVTTANQPNLSWTAAFTEHVTEVIIGRAPEVDATGRLTSVYTSFTREQLQLNGEYDDLTNWADLDQEPLWPNTYYWQLAYTVANADGTTTPVLSPPAKVTVVRVFELKTLTMDMGDFEPSGKAATVPVTFEVKTNLKSVPFQYSMRLNKSTVCLSKKRPLTRSFDLNDQLAELTITCKIKGSYFKKGRNSLVQAGSVGSKATTGKVQPFRLVEWFRLG